MDVWTSLARMGGLGKKQVVYVLALLSHVLTAAKPARLFGEEKKEGK
jgi:hypothetical protein